MKPQTTALVAGGEWEDLLARVPHGWTTRVENGSTHVATYYDTFDGRLYRRGALFTGRGGRGRTQWTLRDGDLLLEQTLDANPAFAADLPAGPLRKRLLKIVSVRRLLPLVKARRQPRTVHVLNEDAKTVVRLRADRVEAAPPGRGPWTAIADRWILVPLRGYEREAAMLERSLGARPDPRNELDHLLAAIGTEAPAYSSKFRLELLPQTPAGTALRRVLKKLVDVLRANEAGAIADVDPEFLHDFRVSVRRSRSCIGQMKRALPMNRVEPFRDELKWLGTVSGPTRDMDVFLLDLKRWQAKLPGKLGESLEPLHELVREDQRREQKKLAAHLRSARYRSLLAGWTAFLETAPEPGEAPQAGRPIVELAEERIRAKYGRIVRKGRKIDALRATEELHQLRIEGKKLRYLLEFFRSLFLEDAVDPLVAALKRLQDNLGEFNDLQVQQSELQTMIPRLNALEDTPTETLVAVGRLLERLARRETALRRGFLAQFEQFASGKTRSLIDRLTPSSVPP